MYSAAAAGPQGLVIGPEDGLLYVTIRSFPGFKVCFPPVVYKVDTCMLLHVLDGCDSMQTFDVNFGAILRFDITTLPGTFKDIFATTVGATDCSQFLHRPEGLTWGPPKSLYKSKLLYVTAGTDASSSEPPVNTVASHLPFIFMLEGVHLHMPPLRKCCSCRPRAPVTRS